MKPLAACLLPLSVLTAAALCVAPAAFAQSFTIEQVMSAPYPSELTASAHGATVAWTADDEGRRNVWLAQGPDFTPRQITHYDTDSGQPIASVRLTPDGSTVLYARGTEKNDAGLSANPGIEPEQPEQQVWAVSVTGGEPKLLGELGCGDEDCEDIQISPDGRYAVWAARHHLWIAEIAGTAKARALTDERGEPSTPRWSPQGDRIAYSIDRGDHTLLAVATVQDGKVVKTDYVAPSVDRYFDPRWSPDGRHLAFLRTAGEENKQPIIPLRPTPWSIWVADTATFDAHEIWHSGTTMRDTLPEFADTSFFYAADDRIIFDSEQDNWGHLYSIDALHGGEPKLLTPGAFEIEDVALSPDLKSVIYSSNQNDIDRRHLWRVDVTGGTSEALTQGETIEWNPTPTGDGSALLCFGSTATTPAMLYRIENGKRVLLNGAELSKDFPSKELVTPKQVIFQSEDGFTIHGQLFMPRNQQGRGPALIFVHGGPMRQMLLGFPNMGYYTNSYEMNEYLASLGFTVLSVNYRLGIMYGNDFRHPANAKWRGSSEYKDVLAGGRYLQTLPSVDPERIGIWGGSYGGLLTALALARNSDIFKAGVDYHGVHDWSIIFQEDDPLAPKSPDFLAARKLAWESSPDASIATWKSPVLLIQGDDDRNVPFNQMVDLVQRLRAAHVPFDQIVYPDEIHGFLLHRHWVESYKAEAKFFIQQLKPAGVTPTSVQ